MNPFTLHTKQHGVSYLEHMVFAIGISYRLWRSVFAFMMHAVFPFLKIDADVDLESTSEFIEERNHWIESKKRNSQYRPKDKEEVTTGSDCHWIRSE